MWFLYIILIIVSHFCLSLNLIKILNVSGKLFTAGTKYSKKVGRQIAKLMFEDYTIASDHQILPCDAPVDFQG